MKTKQRTHNEYFRTVSLGNRKSCPTCRTKLLGESVWSWGEYHNVKWRTVKYFCRSCFKSEVLQLLQNHTDDCGCIVSLVGYQTALPEWLTLECEMVIK
jgi:hypothetical protein